MLNKNGIILQKNADLPDIFTFSFSTNCNKDVDVINHIKNKKFFEIFKLSNPTLIKSIGEFSEDPDITTEGVIITLFNKYNNKAFDTFYDDYDSDSDSETETDSDDIIIFSSNDMIVIDENHFKMKQQLHHCCSASLSIDVVRNNMTTIDFLFEIELKNKINIVKESVFIDIIQNILYNFKNYIS
jgi:hypothetical protein